MLQIAICDDNQLHLEHEKELVRQTLSAYKTEIELFISAENLLRCISCGDYRPDIAVLDIELTGMNGIELAERLNALLPECQIVFLTGHLHYATEVYEAKHIWFVLKEDAEKNIRPALLKAVSASPTGCSVPLGLAAKSGGKTSFVPLQDVLYIDRFGRKSRIVTVNGEIIASQAPNALLHGALSEYFIHCHQGYWVNTQKITALDRNEFVLTDDSRIRISRTFLAESRARFFELFCQS